MIKLRRASDRGHTKLEQKSFPLDKNQGRWTLVASKEGRDGSVTVHQNVDVWTARFSPGEQTIFGGKPSRQAWVHIARGAATLNDVQLSAGDGAAVGQEEMLEFRTVKDAEILLFDLA
jgi:redox-sensitive bicupin YhaK (pirin superfamily)